MTSTPPESWLPKTREDWVGAFADGIALDRSRREEAEAKAKQEADAAGKGGGSDDTSPKKSFAERLLGG
jgi:hypothetical protein